MRRYQMMSSFLALLIGLSGCRTVGNELSGDTTEAAYKDGLKTVQDTYAALDGGRQ